MKKIFYLLLFILMSNISFSQTHNNIRLHPKQDTLCYGTNVYLWIAGQSFFPTNYVWSNGATTSTIQVTSSGTYTLTVTGYLGNSHNLITLTKTKTIVSLPKPEILPLTPTWVCKLDTVKLMVAGGYQNYLWSDGSVGNHFEKAFTMIGTGGAVPDTQSVWVTASLGYCTSNSDTLLLRGIRRPEGLSSLFCGRIDLDTSDFVRCGIVVQYLYPVQYEMEFTDINDTATKITYFPTIGTRKAPLNILTPGSSYYVRTRPIINGQTFCWGDTCTLSITFSPVNFNNTTQQRIGYSRVFQVYDMSGRFIFQKESPKFDRLWLMNYPNQTYIVVSIDEKTDIREIEKINQIR